MGAGEACHPREVGDGQPHLDAPPVLAGDLPLAQEGERFAQRELLPGRLLIEEAVGMAVSFRRVSMAMSRS
jgi:hypothetical protein